MPGFPEVEDAVRGGGLGGEEVDVPVDKGTGLKHEPFEDAGVRNSPVNSQLSRQHSPVVAARIGRIQEGTQALSGLNWDAEHRPDGLQGHGPASSTADARRTPKLSREGVVEFVLVVLDGERLPLRVVVVLVDHDAAGHVLPGGIDVLKAKGTMQD